MTKQSNQIWWVCSRGHVFGPQTQPQHCPAWGSTGFCLDSSHLWPFPTEAEAIAFVPQRKRWMPERGVVKAIRRRGQP